MKFCNYLYLTIFSYICSGPCVFLFFEDVADWNVLVSIIKAAFVEKACKSTKSRAKAAPAAAAPPGKPDDEDYICEIKAFQEKMSRWTKETWAFATAPAAGG